jgi:hypothetical protein
MLTVYSFPVQCLVPSKTEKLLKEIQTWCDLEYGRRAQLGRAIGVGRQVVTNWFAGRQRPTGEQVLLIQEFLKQLPK